MKILAISQARIGSTRLPAKVLKEVEGKTLLQLHLERVLRSRLIHKVVVATTLEEDAGSIVEIATNLGLTSFKGSTNDVLDRFYQAAKLEHPDLIIRITADCPLIDPEVIDELITMALDKQLDYISNSVIRSYPDGMDAEVFTFNALERAWRESVLTSDREHVTPYIWRNSSLKNESLFSAASLVYPQDFSQTRLTIDEPADLDMITLLIRQLGVDHGWKVYADYLAEHPDVSKMNGSIPLNEGYFLSLKND